METNWAQDEGKKAFEQGKKLVDNPYPPYDNQYWWHNEEWEKGFKNAEAADDDD